MRLKVGKITGERGWWIKGHEPAMGPYDTRAEALDAKRGAEAFYLHCDKRGFISSEPVVRDKGRG